MQADEAYQVRKVFTPVAAYLGQDDVIRIALEHGVDMIHPGSVARSVARPAAALTRVPQLRLLV